MLGLQRLLVAAVNSLSVTVFGRIFYAAFSL